MDLRDRLACHEGNLKRRGSSAGARNATLPPLSAIAWISTVTVYRGAEETRHGSASPNRSIAACMNGHGSAARPPVTCALLRVPSDILRQPCHGGRLPHATHMSDGEGRLFSWARWRCRARCVCELYGCRASYDGDVGNAVLAVTGGRARRGLPDGHGMSRIRGGVEYLYRYVHSVSPHVAQTNPSTLTLRRYLKCHRYSHPTYDLPHCAGPRGPYDWWGSAGPWEGRCGVGGDLSTGEQRLSCFPRVYGSSVSSTAALLHRRALNIP